MTKAKSENAATAKKKAATLKARLARHAAKLELLAKTNAEIEEHRLEVAAAAQEALELEAILMEDEVERRNIEYMRGSETEDSATAVGRVSDPLPEPKSRWNRFVDWFNK